MKSEESVTVLRTMILFPLLSRRGEGVRYDLQKVKILKLVQDDGLYPSPDLGRENETFASLE